MREEQQNYAMQIESLNAEVENLEAMQEKMELQYQENVHKIDELHHSLRESELQKESLRKEMEEVSRNLKESLSREAESLELNKSKLEAANEDIQHLRIDKEQLEVAIKEEREKWKRELDAERAVLAEFRLCYSEEVQSLQQDLEQRDNQHANEMDTVRVEISQLRQDLANSDSRVQMLTTELTQLQERCVQLTAENQAAQHLQEELEACQEKWKTALQEKSLMQIRVEAVDSLQKSLEEMEELLEGESKAKEETMKELNLCHQRLVRAQSERDEWKQTMGMYKAAAETVQNALEQKSRHISTLEQEVSRLEDAQVRVQSLQREKEDLYMKCESLRANLTSTQEENRSQKERHECLKQRCEILQTHVQRLEKIGSELKNENRDLKAQLNTLRQSRERENIQLNQSNLTLKSHCQPHSTTSTPSNRVRPNSFFSEHIGEDDPLDDFLLECKRPTLARIGLNASQGADDDLLNTSNAWRERLHQLRTRDKSSAQLALNMSSTKRAPYYPPSSLIDSTYKISKIDPAPPTHSSCAPSSVISSDVPESNSGSMNAVTKSPVRHQRHWFKTAKHFMKKESSDKK